MNGLQVVTVYSRIQPVTDTEQATPAFVKQSRLHIPVLYDSDNKIYREYSVEGSPSSFPVSDKGVILWAEILAAKKSKTNWQNQHYTWGPWQCSAGHTDRVTAFFLGNCLAGKVVYSFAGALSS